MTEIELKEREERAKVTLVKKEKRRGRGRPPKIPIKPTSPEVAQLMRDKQKHQDEYALLQQIKEDADSTSVLDLAMQELAKESASLDFERGEAERKGNDTSSLSSKKINATKALIDTYFRKRETIINETFDFKSKRFRRLFEFWALKIRKSCEITGMGEEQIQRLFMVIGEEFEEWEEEALKYISEGS